VTFGMQALRLGTVTRQLARPAAQSCPERTALVTGISVTYAELEAEADMESPGGWPPTASAGRDRRSPCSPAARVVLLHALMKLGATAFL
jgi:hypothetical protein